MRSHAGAVCAAEDVVEDVIGAAARQAQGPSAILQAGCSLHGVSLLVPHTEPKSLLRPAVTPAHSLSSARAPPCGRLKTELDRVFTCTVTFDDRPRVVSPVTAYGRATEENMAAAAPGLRGDAQRPM